MYMVVDVKTTEADVIARYLSFLLADVIGQSICGRCYDHMLQHEKMFVYGWCYCHVYLW